MFERFVAQFVSTVVVVVLHIATLSLVWCQNEIPYKNTNPVLCESFQHLNNLTTNILLRNAIRSNCIKNSRYLHKRSAANSEALVFPDRENIVYDTEFQPRKSFRKDPISRHDPINSAEKSLSRSTGYQSSRIYDRIRNDDSHSHSSSNYVALKNSNDDYSRRRYYYNSAVSSSSRNLDHAIVFPHGVGSSRSLPQRRPSGTQQRKQDYIQPSGRSTTKSFVQTGTVPYGFLYKWIKQYNNEG